jgi:hypothetical protein
VVCPGEAEAAEAAEREVEERLREGGEEGDEEERRLRGEDRAGWREEGAVGRRRGRSRVGRTSLRGRSGGRLCPG